MPVTDPSATAVVELSRAEQWVLHHVLLDAIDPAGGSSGVAGDGARPSRGVVEKLEAGAFEFTRAELELIRRACRAHARTTEAAADRNLASAVAARIDAALGEGAADR